MLDELAEVEAPLLADHDERRVDLGVELRPNVFAIQAHSVNPRRRYVESARRRVPCDIQARRLSSSFVEIADEIIDRNVQQLRNRDQVVERWTHPSVDPVGDGRLADADRLGELSLSHF